MSTELPLIPDADARERALATDRSIIVQAPAGSGKTTLLASRYVRLLAKAERPEEILAITFTKKAAGEMRHRVLSMLAEDSPLANQIRHRDKEFNWQLLRNPNLLKIQTIDSFALDLASQSPQLDTAAGLRITEHADQFYTQAAADLLRQLYRQSDSNILIAQFLGFLDNDADKAVQLLSYMLGRRDQWLDTVLTIAQSDEENATQAVVADAVTGLHQNLRKQLRALEQPADMLVLEQLASINGAAPSWEAALPLLLTKTGQLRKRLTRKEGLTDAKQLREINQWLQALHQRGFAALLSAYGQMPQVENAEDQNGVFSTLRLCCVCLALAAAELDRLLAAAGVLDFTGLLIRAKTALADANGPTDLALLLDYRIKHILVDEFQDTSRAQIEFFSLLTQGWEANAGNTFFAVGDPMQSIYRFRDADVAIFADTQKNGINDIELEPCVLQANFRADQGVVEWCNELFRQLFDAKGLSDLGEVTFSPAIAMQKDAATTQVICQQFTDKKLETQSLIDRINNLLQQDDHSKIAVLCRTRPAVADLLDQLTQAGIDVCATQMELLASRPVIRDLMALYRYTFNPADAVALMAILRSPMFGMTLAELTLLAQQPDLTQALIESEVRNSALTRFNEARDWSAKRLYEVPLREVLEGLWFRCGGASAYPQTEWRHAQAWFNLIDDLGRDAYALGYVESALQALFAETSSNARVEVLTIHKAKGLEFDHVLLPYLDRRAQHDDAQLMMWRATQHGLLIGVNGDSVHNWLRYEERERARNEEKRLLYVACTRAKRSLSISFSGKSEGKPGGLANWLVDAVGVEQVAQSQAHKTMPPTQDALFDIPNLRRLPPAYTWRAPAYAVLTESSNPAPIQNSDQLSAKFEVALGLLLHRAFAWLADSQTVQELLKTSDELSIAHLATLYEPKVHRWANDYASVDLSSAELGNNAIAQLQTTLAHAQGRWILSAGQHAHSEWALTGVFNGETSNIVIDRTFIEKDRRWIIDYKTGRPGPEETLQTFLAREVSRYMAQLKKYKIVCNALDPRPITTALYFTALGHLEIVDDD